MEMDELVALSVKHNVSDLHLCSELPARWRRQGRLETLQEPVPKPENLLARWLDDAHQRELAERGQTDFAVSLAGGVRRSACPPPCRGYRRCRMACCW